MKFLLGLLTLLALCCCSQYGKVSFEKSPKIINMSSYDPKERQISGESYSPLNQYALRKNGAKALIARCAKGYVIDTKCSDFLVGAERQNMLIGTYFFLLPNQNPIAAADLYIKRLKAIKKNRSLKSPRMLLAADFHTKCNAEQMVRFLKRVHQLTGVRPLVYLENGAAIRSTLKKATSKQKRFLRQHPYWLALYSNTHKKYKTPQQLVKGSKVWDKWAMWQYGGVWWQNGRSKPYHYNQGSWQTPKYFGNLAHPTERSGFNGTTKEFYAFWKKHSWVW